jgi:hypothetical protein
MAAFPEQHRFTLDLQARPGKRQARQARLSVRFGKVCICRPKSCSDPKAPAEIELSAIEVREINPPSGEEPIYWRLLSTRDVKTVEQALILIGWYRQRWHIEQLFRTVKTPRARHREQQHRRGRYSGKTGCYRSDRGLPNHATRARSRLA